MSEANAGAENATQTKYENLTANFMRATFKGQTASAFRAMNDKPGKAQDFIAAIRAGDVKVPAEITSQQRKKLLEMGLEESLLPPVASRATSDESTSTDDNEDESTADGDAGEA